MPRRSSPEPIVVYRLSPAIATECRRDDLAYFEGAEIPPIRTMAADAKPEPSYSNGHGAVEPTVAARRSRGHPPRRFPPPTAGSIVLVVDGGDALVLR